MKNCIKLSFRDENYNLRLIRVLIESNKCIEISKSEYNIILNSLNILIKLCNYNSIDEKSRLKKFFLYSINFLKNENNSKTKELIKDLEDHYIVIDSSTIPEVSCGILIGFFTIVKVIEETKKPTENNGGGIGSTWG